MWPVAPFPPSADSASIEATHAGVPATVLVELLVVGVVVTVVVAVDELVCADELAAALVLAVLLAPPPELPQPASASAASAQITVARVCIPPFSAILSSTPS